MLAARGSIGISRLPFPEKTHGFFYYHLPQSAPLFADGVRFRICPSNDTRTFRDGYDLLKFNGVPWEISNWAFALYNTKYNLLGTELVATGFIRPGALESYRKLLPSSAIPLTVHRILSETAISYASG
ncbi:hypothetical protein D9758_008020 [Tetrapyrgos nigripes]|uniref:Uncharacterized protein n=1 Tax=Tetrapyrgos nigripes TaxID=182062 RepID=A0A8H5FW69_9AGAR|nr:hypothetical protein D9758_008020 [Tetrapyrgos nigripes]